jgi:hypothetical protein
MDAVGEHRSAAHRNERKGDMHPTAGSERPQLRHHVSDHQ